MLTISSGYDPGYLTRAVATGRENYYLSAVAEHGEPPGIWTGLGCPELGLPVGSEVNNKVMERLYGAFIDPRDPEHKATLGRAPSGFARNDDKVSALIAARLAAEPEATEERRDPGWPREIQGHLAVHDRPAVSCADESHPGIDELVPVKHRRKVGDATLPAVHISLPPVEWLFFLFSVQDRNLAIPDRLRRCLAFTVIARLDHLQMILLWWYSLVHATWKPVSEARYHCRS
jgi:hypothetical protein